MRKVSHRIQTESKQNTNGRPLTTQYKEEERKNEMIFIRGRRALAAGEASGQPQMQKGDKKKKKFSGWTRDGAHH